MAGDKRGPASTTRRPNPTRDVLISTVVDLLETANPEDIRVEEVLSRADVSPGSLYHYFENYSDLMDQAIIARYVNGIEVSIAISSRLAEDATDLRSLASGLRATTARAMHPDRERERFNRAQVMARAAAKPRFREALLPHQERLNLASADLFRTLQGKGLIDPSVDPVVGGLFIQAYSMGFVVNDVSGHPADEDAVVELLMLVLERAFFAEEDPA